jgi:4-amino-4-deoxy-L-arabinose transferase-like glycosyltransferase
MSLHAVNVVLVFALACRLPISRPAAFFCAALFAAHGTRPEAAAWIAGRFDLVATFFVLVGLLLFLRTYAAAGRARYIGRVLSLACMVLAVLSKESAYIFPLLLVVLPMAKNDLSRRRVARVVPFFVAGAALFAYRL